MALKRFVVAEDSMLPGLESGTEILATDSRRSKPNDLVVFPHPGRTDFWMVKRRVEPPHPLLDHDAWVLSDNPTATLADSRTLGPIPVDQLWPVLTRLDEDLFIEATVMLCDEDQALAAVVEKHGLPEFWSRPPGLGTLVLLILEQQVSLESGAAVYRRLLAGTGQMTPDAILKMGDARIREAGITRQKAGYILALAEAVATGDFDLEAVGAAPIQEARTMLTGLRGIGPWTADAYLLSALGHLDVFPLGDRALQVGAGEVLGMTTIPDEDELEILSLPWRPLRAVAARLIWHAYLSSRGRTEPVHRAPEPK